ncbi:hypothetical protein ACLGIH_17460 [Streptomyces sp. HMX87]|uniref:hypothetical protein n=1 Tax=Streptomyces sp. HMX87 TaxID=3390849 RepID=UPI003A83E76D
MNDVETQANGAAAEPPPGAGGRGGRRRGLLAGLAVGGPALVLAVAAAGRLLVGQDGAGGRVTEDAADARWADGITPQWMSEVMGVGVPATARSPQAAYEVTSRFDTGLLTFTLTRSEAEAYLKRHPPSGAWLEPTSAPADATPHDFAHLGLREPEEFGAGVRYGYVCPGTGGASAAPGDPYGAPGAHDTSDGRCVRLYAHEYSPQRTRIYLRAHFEPGISPLPATPASPS